ncbi:MAG: hypothetical protein KAT11_00595 [Phycisphaerae bacterium]|nr:hypothetical protein [Phycisphaerae bacterium]
MFSRQFPKSGLSILFCFLVIFCAIGPEVLAGPYSDGISDGIAYDDPSILAWATGCTVERQPYAGYPSFGDWSDAIGPAPGTLNDVVSLGIGGSATLSFDITIADGTGPDLAVFENAMAMGSNVYAELAFVEVSSNGDDFVRFPNCSLTPRPMVEPPVEEWPFISIDPTDVDNLAGKHVNNITAWLGTPFDLADLVAEPLVQSGIVSLANINYVRVIDVIGDGLTLDSQGHEIYDPWCTDFLFEDDEHNFFETGGFDLDAVAVLNTTPLPGDVDGNGFVDDDDLSIIISNWGQSNATREDGDLDGDGTVAGRDYSEVLSYWGTGSSAEPPAHVPTPATLWLLLLAAVAGFWSRARERISK